MVKRTLQRRLLMIVMILVLLLPLINPLLTDRLELYYSMNTGTVSPTAVNDSTTNLKHAINTGGRINIPGFYNQSILFVGNFAGSSNYTATSIAIVENASWTIAGWLWPNGSTDWFGLMMDIGKDSSNWVQFYARKDQGYPIAMYCRDNAGSKCNGAASGEVKAAINLTANSWQLLIVQHNHTAHYYRTCKNLTCWNTSYTMGDIEAFTSFRIGDPINSDWPGHFQIDEVGFWNRSLSMDEIIDLYGSYPYPFEDEEPPTSSCTWEPGADWWIRDYCNITTTVDICPYRLIVNGTGKLNLSGGRINASQYIFAAASAGWRVSIIGGGLHRCN